MTVAAEEAGAYPKTVDPVQIDFVGVVVSVAKISGKFMSASRSWPTFSLRLLLSRNNSRGTTIGLEGEAAWTGLAADSKLNVASH